MIASGMNEEEKKEKREKQLSILTLLVCRDVTAKRAASSGAFFQRHAAGKVSAATPHLFSYLYIFLYILVSSYYGNVASEEIFWSFFLFLLPSLQKKRL